MSTQVSSDTQASALASSPAVGEAIDALLRELAQCQATITEPRPANPDLKLDYAKEVLRNISRVWGRPT